MKISYIILCFVVISPYLLSAGIPSTMDHIVGYENRILQRGLNEVTVNFDVVADRSAFTTLDKVVKFSPEDGILGDEIEFELDGIRQRYKFVEYCSTNKAYRLVCNIKNATPPQVISLASIPLPNKFLINHIGTNIVSVNSFGEVSQKYKRAALYSQGLCTNNLSLKIVLVPLDGQSRCFTFESGSIESKSK